MKSSIYITSQTRFQNPVVCNIISSWKYLHPWNSNCINRKMYLRILYLRDIFIRSILMHYMRCSHMTCRIAFKTPDYQVFLMKRKYRSISTEVLSNRHREKPNGIICVRTFFLKHNQYLRWNFVKSYPRGFGQLFLSVRFLDIPLLWIPKLLEISRCSDLRDIQIIS